MSHYNSSVPKRVTKGNLWGFIQSRPYASVADMRRLFTMGVDDASILPTSEGTYFIGLPQEAADLISQLWHEGRIVLDTNPDVKALVVQGVYPARAMLGRQPIQGYQQMGKGPAGQRTSQSVPAPRPTPPSHAAAGFESRLVTAIAGEAEEMDQPGASSASGGSAGAGARPGKRRRRHRRQSANGEGGAAGAAGVAQQPAVAG